MNARPACPHWASEYSGPAPSSVGAFSCPRWALPRHAGIRAPLDAGTARRRPLGALARQPPRQGRRQPCAAQTDVARPRTSGACAAPATGASAANDSAPAWSQPAANRSIRAGCVSLTTSACGDASARAHDLRALRFLTDGFPSPTPNFLKIVRGRFPTVDLGLATVGPSARLYTARVSVLR